MKIVCISGKAQHGKDTTAKLLEEILEAQGNRVLIAHYGDLVKYVCKTFFGWDGKKDEKGRTLLQRVGTDKIRAVSPDYWVDFIVSILDIFCDEWDYVLIPDTRFPNEYEIYELRVSVDRRAAEARFGDCIGRLPVRRYDRQQRQFGRSQRGRKQLCEQRSQRRTP